MTPVTLRQWHVSLATAIALSGCSLTFMEAAPANSRAQPRCTDDTEMPWLDVGIASLEGAMGTAVGVVGVRDGRGGSIALGVALMGIAVAHVYSATQGFEIAHECETLKLRRETPSSDVSP